MEFVFKLVVLGSLGAVVGALFGKWLLDFVFAQFEKPKWRLGFDPDAGAFDNSALDRREELARGGEIVLPRAEDGDQVLSVEFVGHETQVRHRVDGDLRSVIQFRRLELAERIYDLLLPELGTEIPRERGRRPESLARVDVAGDTIHLLRSEACFKVVRMVGNDVLGVVRCLGEGVARAIFDLLAEEDPLAVAAPAPRGGGEAATPGGDYDPFRAAGQGHESFEGADEDERAGDFDRLFN